MTKRSAVVFRLLRPVVAGFFFCAGLGAVSTAAAQDVLTQHNDTARTGQNLNETTLTPANVKSATFGKRFTVAVDGRVDAQPLYVSGETIPGLGVRNLLIVASEHGSLYAFDADTGVGIWSVTLLKTGETPADPMGCKNDEPEQGITATPVID